MLGKEDLQNILNKRTNGRLADLCDIFTEQTSSTSILFEEGRLDKLTSGCESGQGIRIIKGEEIDYEFSSTPDDLKIKNSVPIEKKLALTKKADAAARSVSPLIVQVTVSYGDLIQETAIANTRGAFASGSRVRTRFMINVVAKKDGVIQTGYETAGATTGFELFDSVKVEELAEKAGQRAVMMLSARHAPSGMMPVVIMSEAGGTLIHEACGHGLEADFIVKKTSVYHGRIGQHVASPLITVVDDATIPGLYGSFAFDDEGTPSQKKVLIEHGVLKGYMSDIYNSVILKIPSSGNGRRENFSTKPQPRMTNTYIEKGNDDPLKIIDSIKEGLLVKKLGGGQVNVTNGDFVFDVQESYLVRNGKIKEPVRGAMLIGNGPEILNRIDMVGNDLNFIIGTCGKSDHAPVTDAMPTIRIPEIVVGGRD